MAALDALERSGRFEVSQLGDDQVRLAVTILHSVPADRLSPDRLHPAGVYRPKWFSQVLRDRSEVDRGRAHSVIEQKLAMGCIPASELRALVGAEDHRNIAALICLPLLGRFPVGSENRFSWRLAGCSKPRW